MFKIITVEAIILWIFKAYQVEEIHYFAFRVLPLKIWEALKKDIKISGLEQSFRTYSFN